MTTAADATTQAEDNKLVISAHNMELDSRMGGGIPVGSLVLIEGGSGSGKSVLSQQMIWGALQDSFHVTLFTSENSVKSLVSQMKSIDLDVLDHLLLNRLRVYPIELSRLQRSAPMALLRVLNMQERPDVLVVDSFTAAMVQDGVAMEVRQFFEGCKRLCATGKTVFVTIHTDAAPADLIAPIRSMCDAHLKLKSEQDGQRLVKTLEVAKVRGAASATGAIVGFDVEPGWGMRVIPISKARG
jgi:flagellar protein FlaH